MCATYTVHFTCGCDEPGRTERNGCDGNCTGDQIVYDEALDQNAGTPCAVHQYLTPVTSKHQVEVSVGRTTGWNG